MNNETIFAELESIINQQGIEVKFGRGYFEGGICRYKDNRYLYLNRAKDVEHHINLMISEIKKMNLELDACSADLKHLLGKTESN
jgi:hypothetical protein